MAVNKNFVVKNGLEVNSNLIFADATIDKVGVGTAVPKYPLHVLGGIGVTDSFVTGVSTISNQLRVGTNGQVFSVIAGPSGVGQSVGVGTAYPAYLLDVRSSVSTGQTALYVYGDLRVTGDLNIDDIVLDQIDANRLIIGQSLQLNNGANLYVTGISTFSGPVDITSNLKVAGITTLSSVIVGSAVTINSSGINASGVSTFSGITTVTGSTLFTKQLNVSGVSTFAGITTVTGSTLFSKQLNVSGVSTLAGITTVTGETLFTKQLNVSGVSTFSGITTVTGETLFTKQLNVSGVSTLGSVRVSSGIITATSGVVTYYGDGSYLTGNARNLTATIGIRTEGSVLGYGVSFIDLRGPGVSTAYYNSSVGIATIYISGGTGSGGSASIGIGSTPGDAFVGVITSGNLWYNTNLGRLFIYYQDTNSAQWVDAAPFNLGIITSIGSLSFPNGSASSPSWYFNNSSTTGVFSPSGGQLTFVSAGSSILNINPSGINVTGFVTSTSLKTGIITSGNIYSTGIVTATDFNSLSDINYKKNVNTVNNALLKVDQLRGVKFDWKESGLPSYGVIAQELEQVLPELVHGTDPRTVNYNGIIGVLIEAIKELKAEVEELKNTK